MLMTMVRRARGALLVLGCATVHTGLWAQGTVTYIVPSQPIYYAPIDGSHDLDLDGDGAIDFTLLSNPSETVLVPHGHNRMVVVPELPPDIGSFVAPLNPGDEVNSSPSSLNPIFAWFDPQTDPVGYSLIAGFSTAGSAGYFFGGIHYVGVSFDYGGANHYGWMEIDSFSPSVPAGQVLRWGFETRQDTPISAGQVPEPHAFELIVWCAGIVATLKYARRRENTSQ
jgi:hypothetical protein